MIDIHEVNGISGTFVVPTSAETQIPEMTETLSLLTGDKVILTLQIDYYIAMVAYVYTAIRADGIKISNDVRWGNYSSGSSTTYSRYGAVVIATYTAIADGDVVFDAIAKSYNGGAQNLSNTRKMILEHIH